MPLRKSQGPKTVLAGAAAAVALAAVPATASAASWTSWLSSWSSKSTSTSTSTTTTTTPAPAPEPAPAPAPEPAPAPAPATSGGVSGADAEGCVEQPTTKAYAKFGDTADYAVAPGASFEGGQGDWTFSKKTWPWDEGKVASIVSGNDGNNILAGSKSLQIQEDGYARSPRFCVDESHPHFRFSYKVTGWATKFNVLVVYRDLAGKVQEADFLSSMQIKLFPGTWQVSPASPLATNIPLVAGGNAASVQVYLTVDNGTVQFDNFMVDPYRRR